jgi:hypothetical protein
MMKKDLMTGKVTFRIKNHLSNDNNERPSKEF